MSQGNYDKWLLISFISTIFWLLFLIVGLRSKLIDEELLFTWFSAISGGIGTIFYILSSIYRRWTIKRCFTRHYAIHCLTYPILGIITGAGLYEVGYSLASFLLGVETLTTFWVEGGLIVLSWIVGYQIIGKRLFERSAAR